jgi:hypothetical protein
MSNIQFEDSNARIQTGFQSRSVLGQPETPGMVKRLIQLGIVKEEKTAGRLLTFLAIAVFLLAAFIMGRYVFLIGNSRYAGPPDFDKSPFNVPDEQE